MERSVRIQFGIMGFFFILLLSSMAFALPSSQFIYDETDLGTGMWQYDYTLKNTSDPILDAGFDLYDVFFNYDFTASFSVLSLPTDWILIDGSGFGQSFSTLPGTAPFGADIAPGESLSGFSFLFDYQAGSLAYEATFVNPEDFDPIVEGGNSIPAAAPVPEPGTFFLLATSLVGLAVGVRKKVKND